ncbi:MAG: hypothetical protein MRY21_07035 [Simkaniaceae bacterium]|nr:hypothetical protein [Simkaniaceae bacterium]
MNVNQHWLHSARAVTEFVKGLWWVFAFIFVTYGFYFLLMQSKESDLLELQARLELMQVETALALRDQDELRLRIESQSDPCFIEMMLMRTLGVVPEGQVKVHFRNSGS